RGLHAASGARAGGTPWLAVAPAEGISISGWVPASVRGTVWEDGVAPSLITRHTSMTLLRAPQQEAPVVAGIGADVPIRIIDWKARAGGWLEVTIAASHATVHGFMLPSPPPPPSTDAMGEGEGEGDREPAAPAMPYPVGTCLRDAPNGTIVGMVRGPLAVTPVHEVGAWHAVVLPTVWGEITLYVDGAPTPPPSPPAFEWNGYWPGADE
ncbi:MAG: hypothetical protein H0T79_07840, partial [Deltaproteobacteria bacterium]|nr:hypothetical protein [Deltaproteobacteria bacterium]